MHKEKIIKLNINEKEEKIKINMIEEEEEEIEKMETQLVGKGLMGNHEVWEAVQNWHEAQGHEERAAARDNVKRKFQQYMPSLPAKNPILAEPEIVSTQEQKRRRTWDGWEQRGGPEGLLGGTASSSSQLPQSP